MFGNGRCLLTFVASLPPAVLGVSLATEEERRRMRHSAETALHHWRALPSTPGNWDNFIPKHVEVRNVSSDFRL